MGGGGWLADLNFYDFAGSTFVHSVGGWVALSGALILGLRLGKYVNGMSKPIMDHNFPLETIGVFLLWLGWFGLNGGSVLSADPGAVSYVFVTACIAAAAGIMSAMITSWIIQKKPDLTMVLNDCLPGRIGRYHCRCGCCIHSGSYFYRLNCRCSDGGRSFRR